MKNITSNWSYKFKVTMFLNWFPMILMEAFSENCLSSVSKPVCPRNVSKNSQLTNFEKQIFGSFRRDTTRVKWHDSCRPKNRRGQSWTRLVSILGIAWHESCTHSCDDILKSPFLIRNSWNFLANTFSPSSISSHPQMHLKHPRNVKVTV